MVEKVIAVSLLFVLNSFFPQISLEDKLVSQFRMYLPPEYYFPAATQSVEVPQRINLQSVDIELSARSAVALDYNSGKILYEKNALESRPIASLTKLITALTIVEKVDLDDWVSVSREAAQIEGAKIKIKPGEEFRTKDLLRGLLVASASDAAWALAEFEGEGSTEEFVRQMNREVATWGVVATHLQNPVGLDHPENFSSALDIALIFREFSKNKFLLTTTQEKKAEIISREGKIYRFYNTNQLLDSYLNIVGGKTGFTDEAGETLVLLTEDKLGNKIITVVLGSEDRFQDSKALVWWVNKNYKWD